MDRSIIRMDDEVKKSLFLQKSEILRFLNNSINRIMIIIFKNKVLIIEKRIEDIKLKIGDDFTNLLIKVINNK
jgi:hypothetical protein